MDESPISEGPTLNSGIEFYDMAAGFLLSLSTFVRECLNQDLVNDMSVVFDHIDALQDWLNIGGKEGKNYDRAQVRQLILELFLDENCPYLENDWPQYRGVGNKVTLLSAFLSRLEKCTSKTSFFRTDSDLFGLGPTYCQEDDVVCIVPGIEYPLLLRPLDDDNDIYEYVGPCFIVGLMYGEAIDAIDNGVLSLEDFKIK